MQRFIKQLAFQPWVLLSLILALVLSGCAEGGSTASAEGDPSAPDTTATAETEADAAEMTVNANAGGGGGNNIVQVNNRVDGRLLVRGSIKLNQIPGPTVAPENVALARATCIDCQTLAVALQINLISRTAQRVTPVNAAVAVNFDCVRCYTVARALQYVYSVDDPKVVPPEVDDLLKTMERELHAVETDKNITLEEAEGRINAVITSFSELAKSLNDARDETTETTNSDATPTDETATPLDETITPLEESATPTAEITATTSLAATPTVTPSGTTTPAPSTTPPTTTTSTPTTTTSTPTMPATSSTASATAVPATRTTAPATAAPATTTTAPTAAATATVRAGTATTTTTATSTPTLTPTSGP